MSQSTVKRLTNKPTFANLHVVWNSIGIRANWQLERNGIFFCDWFPINIIQIIVYHFRLDRFGYIDFASSRFKWRTRHNHNHFVKNTNIFYLKNLDSMFFTLKFQVSIDLNFHKEYRCFPNDKWLVFKNKVNFFFISPFWKWSVI